MGLKSRINPRLFGAGNFRHRVFWAFVPIFCGLFIVLGLVDFYKQKALSENEVKERAKAMADNLAYASRLAVLTEDYRLLNSALQSVTGATDFAYVWVYGEKWKLLTQATTKQLTSNSLNEQLQDLQKSRLTQKRGSVSSEFTANNVKYFERIVPITTTESILPYELQIEDDDIANPSTTPTRERTIGAVRLGLSLAGVESHMASFLKWRAVSIVSFLLLGSLAIYIMSGRITRPINQLTQQAKTMSQGILNQTISIDSHDEIGQLAMSFNDMSRSLNDLYSGLENKVAERTKELTAANAKLAEANEHKSRFLANVNHELRTPVSAIIGYGKLLRRKTAGQIAPAQQAYIDDLLDNAERLLIQIDSLLDLATIEAGKMTLHVESVAVDEIIAAAEATIVPMVQLQQVRLSHCVDPNLPLLQTDREKLRQILLNLLVNAAKFTERGEIKISAAGHNGTLKLEVSDTGIGIRKEDIQRIFDEFHRGELACAEKYRGAGLGLAIVKKLVHLLDGEIGVVSEPGKGSTFTVTLPWSPGQHAIT